MNDIKKSLHPNWKKAFIFAIIIMLSGVFSGPWLNMAKINPLAYSFRFLYIIMFSYFFISFVEYILIKIKL